jgi:hypothetical protein
MGCDMGAMYASPPWDIRHNFVFNGIYEFPFGKGKAYRANANPVLQGILGKRQINGIETAYRLLLCIEHPARDRLLRLQDRRRDQSVLSLRGGRQVRKRGSFRRVEPKRVV